MIPERRAAFEEADCIQINLQFDLVQPGCCRGARARAREEGGEEHWRGGGAPARALVTGGSLIEADLLQVALDVKDGQLWHSHVHHDALGSSLRGAGQLRTLAKSKHDSFLSAALLVGTRISTSLAHWSDVREHVKMKAASNLNLWDKSQTATDDILSWTAKRVRGQGRSTTCRPRHYIA